MEERSKLRVEGTDDKHTILHLLIRHGIDFKQETCPAWVPWIEQAEDKDKLLLSVKVSVRTNTDRAVGFVLDADSSLQDRWRAMSSRLRDVGVDDVPEDIPPEGFVGESQKYRTRVGVWLMPDNQREGALEDFIRTLVEEADPLLPHARESTIQAKKLHGANYRDVDEKKAVLHAWLAWQEEPGLPYGTAIRARYFRQDSPVAERFVAWFRRVFELE